MKINPYVLYETNIQIILYACQSYKRIIYKDWYVACPISHVHLEVIERSSFLDPPGDFWKTIASNSLELESIYYIHLLNWNIITCKTK